MYGTNLSIWRMSATMAKACPNRDGDGAWDRVPKDAFKGKGDKKKKKGTEDETKIQILVKTKVKTNVCHYCVKKGHWQSNCYEKKDDGEKERDSTAPVVSKASKDNGSVHIIRDS